MSNYQHSSADPQEPRLPLPAVRLAIGENNGWRLDHLEDGQYRVRQQGKEGRFFSERGEAVRYYLGESPIDKAYFGPLVTEASTQPVLYQTLHLLSRTLDGVLDDLFDNSAYWRAENRPQKQIYAAWSVTQEFIGAVRFNRSTLAAEGITDPAGAAKQVFLAAEARIEELAAQDYLE